MSHSLLATLKRTKIEMKPWGKNSYRNKVKS